MIEDGDRVQLVTLYVRVLLHLAENPKISQETLARRLDVTMRTVQRHLTQLETEGFVHVDRAKKPFQYSIDWAKPIPTVAGVNLIILHPDVMPALHGLSELATRAYSAAESDGADVSQALRALLSERPEAAPV